MLSDAVKIVHVALGRKHLTPVVRGIDIVEDRIGHDVFGSLPSALIELRVVIVHPPVLSESELPVGVIIKIY